MLIYSKQNIRIIFWKLENIRESKCFPVSGKAKNSQDYLTKKKKTLKIELRREESKLIVDEKFTKSR